MAAQLPVEQNSHQFFCQGRRVVWWDWVTTDPSVLVPVLSVPASTSRTSRSRPLLNPPNQSCDSECSQLLLLFTLSLDPKWPQGFHLELMWDGEEAMWWPSEHWVRTQIRLDKQKTEQRDVLEPVGSVDSVPATPTPTPHQPGMMCQMGFGNCSFQRWILSPNPPVLPSCTPSTFKSNFCVNLRSQDHIQGGGLGSQAPVHRERKGPFIIMGVTALQTPLWLKPLSYVPPLLPKARYH